MVAPANLYKPVPFRLRQWRDRRNHQALNLQNSDWFRKNEVKMSQSAEKYYTPEEYLALEEKSDRKSEYYDGIIYLMAGGSGNHNLISGNAYFELRLCLRGVACTVVNNEMRIYAQDSEFFTYSDTAVVCGPLIYAPRRNDTITNPVLVVEVLSPSTRNYDRSDKFDFYRSIETFQTYLVIDQFKIFVECYQRQADNTWNLKTYTDPEQEIELESLGVSLKVGPLYADVTFPVKQPKRPREKIIPHPSIEN